MRQQFVVPVALGVALVAGAPASAARGIPQEVDSDASGQTANSRTFRDRVKILFGMGEEPREAAPAPPQPVASPPPAEARPVQTFNEVEIELDAFGGDDSDEN